MVSIHNLNKNFNEILLNDLNSIEVTEFYKMLNSKLIKTIGTVENNFNCDTDKQHQLNKEIGYINSIFNEKFSTSELDISTKFNVLLKEFLTLQKHYINNEIVFLSIQILEKHSNIYRSMIFLKRTFIELYFNFIQNTLTTELESVLNFSIEFHVNNINEDILFFKNLSLKPLSYFESNLNYNVEVENVFNNLLNEVNNTIAEYENLINNPFKDSINIEFDVISKVYFSESDILREQKKVLENVPIYDFTNFKLKSLLNNG